MTQDHEPSKISSTLSGIAGSAKEMYGKVIGSETTQMEGATQKAAANAEYAAAQQQQYNEGTKDRVVGWAKEAKGSVMGNTEERLEGKAQNSSGSAQQEASNV